MNWLAFGTGVGIEVGARDLTVSVVRVRPGGARVSGWLRIEDFRARHATEWGTEYAAFLKAQGASHVAAVVLLPRADVIMRTVALPGVSSKDLAAAVLFQAEALHPYAEDDVVTGFARLGDTSHVLIGIARRTVVDELADLFGEAGVAVRGFSFSASAIHSAIRLWGAPAEGVATHEAGEGVEVYAESAARPVFSVNLAGSADAVLPRVLAEMRLPAETAARALNDAIPGGGEHPLARAAALASACPRLALPLNLLPAARRVESSRAMFIPAAVLASVLALLAVALSAESALQERRLRETIAAEIQKLEPQAKRAAELERVAASTEGRLQQIAEFRGRAKADLDAIREVTRLLPPPAYLGALELYRESIVVAGETESAAELLKIIDASPLFRNAEFTVPITRVEKGETFRIRAQREGVAK
ncbi:MAG: hypothetical protein FJW40_10330 [Acidobacteria bacterium]|nr:hypothetical protein [Acidobacteriota bacterium]